MTAPSPHRGPAHGRWAAAAVSLAGLAAAALIVTLAGRLDYDGPRGLGAYQIAGVTYTPVAAERYETTGTASWYGRQFHGRPAANGTTYDKNGFTAAHRTLPLGSRVRVTNLENGRSVLLQITDRGPFVDGRIIDVSRRAAKELGFLEDGLTEVRIEMLRSGL